MQYPTQWTLKWYSLRGARRVMYDSSWDLATPGSPMRQMLMFPTRSGSGKKRAHYPGVPLASGENIAPLLRAKAALCIKGPRAEGERRRRRAAACSHGGLTPNLHAPGVLVHAPHQQEEEGLFDILMAIDLGGDGGRQLVIEILLCKGISRREM